VTQQAAPWNMKNKSINTHVNDNQITNRSSSQAGPFYQEIKLGIDLHVESLRMVRMIDGSTPQPPIGVEPGQMEDYIRKQLALAKKVYTCYEAGPCGFGLHRQLTQLGVENRIVRPVCLDSQHKGVNTDNTDATELVLRLDR
jgi:transposase